MKSWLLIFLFPAFAYAAPAVLTINDSNSFFSATNGVFIQNGHLIDFRHMDPSRPSCAVYSNNARASRLVGDLVFLANAGKYSAEFKYKSTWGFLQLDCTDSQRPMTVTSLLQTLYPIARIDAE